MGGDIQIDATKDKAYGYVQETYGKNWNDETKRQFDYYYQNYKINALSDEPNYNTEQRLMQEQQINSLQNKYERNRANAEGRDPEPIPFDEYERRSEIYEEEYDRWNEIASENAAIMALAELNAMGYIDDVGPVDLMEGLDAKDRQAQVDEAIASLAEKIQLNLVRGAYLQCDCGSHLRMLNLTRDHGVTVKELPQVHINDAKPGVRGDPDEGYNIGWFGHCSAPDHPTERIRLKPFVQTSMEGQHMQTQDDSTKEDFLCIPEFTHIFWNNAGEDQMNIKLGTPLVATLRSYIMCRHGGIIFPLTSGQEEVYMYTPDYAECPFPVDRTDLSDFMQWCDENGKCPYDPGTGDYDAWYNDKMKDTKKDSDANELYQKWLEGMVQSGAANDPATIARINNSNSNNNVRETYYTNRSGKPSTFDEEVTTEKAKYGSNGQKNASGGGGGRR